MYTSQACRMHGQRASTSTSANVFLEYCTIPKQCISPADILVVSFSIIHTVSLMGSEKPSIGLNFENFLVVLRSVLFVSAVSVVLTVTVVDQRSGVIEGTSKSSKVPVPGRTMAEFGRTWSNRWEEPRQHRTEPKRHSVPVVGNSPDPLGYAHSHLPLSSDRPAPVGAAMPSSASSVAGTGDLGRRLSQVQAKFEVRVRRIICGAVGLMRE